MPASDDAARQILSLLGRSATPEEVAYFNKFIADEGVTPYEIGQMVQSSPEYQGKQLDQNATAYMDKLNASNADILGMAGAQAQSRFASLGRPATSAQAGALGQAAQNLAMSRQNSLAAFYGQGLQNNAAMAASQGMNAQNRAFGLRDERRQRQYQIEDYYRQQNDYQNSKNSMSGWNAITPEYGVGTLAALAGKAMAAKAGASSGAPPTGGGGLVGSGYGYTAPRNSYGYA